MTEKMYRVEKCAVCPHMTWSSQSAGRCAHPSHDPHPRETWPFGGIPDWCPIEDAPTQPDERIAALSRAAAELEDLCDRAWPLIANAMNAMNVCSPSVWIKAADDWRDRWFRWTDENAPEKEPAA